MTSKELGENRSQTPTLTSVEIVEKPVLVTHSKITEKISHDGAAEEHQKNVGSYAQTTQRRRQSLVKQHVIMEDGECSKQLELESES